VDDYYKCFNTLSCRDMTLSEPQQIQLFITGFGDPLCMDVALQQPSTLDDTVIFTSAYEQRNAPCKMVSSQPARSASRYTSRTLTLPVASATAVAPAPSVTSVNKPASSSIRLSLSEIAQRHKDGKCFKCDELFTPGHRQQCKWLLIIEVVDDEEGDGLSPTDGELTIPIHTPAGVQPRAGRTMMILVAVNGIQLIALLDSSSTQLHRQQRGVQGGYRVGQTGPSVRHGGQRRQTAVIRLLPQHGDRGPR
jgi:hypothetical protein